MSQSGDEETVRQSQERTDERPVLARQQTNASSEAGRLLGIGAEARRGRTANLACNSAVGVLALMVQIKLRPSHRDRCGATRARISRGKGSHAGARRRLRGPVSTYCPQRAQKRRAEWSGETSAITLLTRRRAIDSRCGKAGSSSSANQRASSISPFCAMMSPLS